MHPWREVLGALLTQTDAGQFSLPITTDTTSYFITARLAARHMIANESGVIMTVTGLRAPMSSSLSGGYGPAEVAKETITRDLSYELAPYGVRVVGLRTSGIPEADTMAEVIDIEGRPNEVTWDQLQDYLAGATHPKRVMTLDEVAKVAVSVESDRASELTGATINLTMGTIHG
jgi:NAD(P)-dependent dehydrogenase (short-subunit alcohol dehydrogenase family)